MSSLLNNIPLEIIDLIDTEIKKYDDIQRRGFCYICCKLASYQVCNNHRICLECIEKDNIWKCSDCVNVFDKCIMNFLKNEIKREYPNTTLDNISKDTANIMCENTKLQMILRQTIRQPFFVKLFIPMK